MMSCTILSIMKGIIRPWYKAGSKENHNQLQDQALQRPALDIAMALGAQTPEDTARRHSPKR